MIKLIFFEEIHNEEASKEHAQEEDITISNPIFQACQAHVKSRNYHPLNGKYLHANSVLMFHSKLLGYNKPKISDAVKNLEIMK